MTTLRNTAVAAMAALTIALAASSPANALSKKGAFYIGLGTAAAFAGAAHAHGHGYYGYGGASYHGGNHYRRTARRCARKWGWHTGRFDDCMYNHGY